MKPRTLGIRLRNRKLSEVQQESPNSFTENFKLVDIENSPVWLIGWESENESHFFLIIFLSRRFFFLQIFCFF